MNCCHCGKEICNVGSLASHEMVCSKNPNKIKHQHSDSAGAKLGSTPWNKGIKTGGNKIWREKYPNSDIFVENSSFSRHSLKKRILEDNLIDYVCSICGCGPEWLGNPMPLVLDHINGISNDHRIENIRFVCSNCDSQLITYKSKNRKKKLTS